MRDRTAIIRKEEEDKIINIAKSKHPKNRSRSRSITKSCVDQDATLTGEAISQSSPNRSVLTTSRLEEFEQRLKKYDAKKI